MRLYDFLSIFEASSVATLEHIGDPSMPKDVKILLLKRSEEIVSMLMKRADDAEDLYDFLAALCGTILAAQTKLANAARVVHVMESTAEAMEQASPNVIAFYKALVAQRLRGNVLSTWATNAAEETKKKSGEICMYDYDTVLAVLVRAFMDTHELLPMETLKTLHAVAAECSQRMPVCPLTGESLEVRVKEAFGEYATSSTENAAKHARDMWETDYEGARAQTREHCDLPIFEHDFMTIAGEMCALEPSSKLDGRVNTAATFATLAAKDVILARPDGVQWNQELLEEELRKIFEGTDATEAVGAIAVRIMWSLDRIRADKEKA